MTHTLSTNVRPRRFAGAGPGVEESLRQIRVRGRAGNEPVVIEHLPPALRLVGFGTDALVVAHPAAPDVVFKVYTPQSIDCLNDEYACYQRLAGSTLFAECHGRGDFYLCLSYEAGPTLYQCLTRGIPVDAGVIADVEAARRYAREVGLHPKDVHLKNVLVQGTRGKILDVSKYAAPGDEDRVWETLAEGYRRFYPVIRGRRIPVWVIELAKRTYRAQGEQFSIDAFMSRMARTFRPAA